uniref:Uncharacterized protein n=1 Tax=Amphidinium carterae TaxID=2961 RepID=A7YXG3_AMPCA|nr:unknown [Amphidinium carterae]
MALVRSTALITVATSAFLLAMFSPASFVEPGLAPSSARGHEVSSSQQDRFRPFTATADAPTAEASSVAGVVAMAATLGLALGLVATPVNAEESETASTRAARKARRAEARKAEADAAKAAKSSESGAGFALPALPSLPNPFAGGDVVKQAAPVVDADDRSPVASDPVALLFIFFTVPTIYLVFYVLGSVDVI